MFKVTLNQKTLDKKFAKADELIGDKIEEKITSLGTYAVQISPVYSGAFVESWSVRPLGSGGGRSRQSRPERAPDAQAKKEEAKAMIRSDVAQYRGQIVEQGGAVLTNRAPHARAVDAKHGTLATVRDKFR